MCRRHHGTAINLCQYDNLRHRFAIRWHAFSSPTVDNCLILLALPYGIGVALAPLRERAAMNRELIELFLITLSGVIGTVLTWLLAEQRGKHAITRQHAATQNRPVEIPFLLSSRNKINQGYSNEKSNSCYHFIVRKLATRDRPREGHTNNFLER